VLATAAGWLGWILGTGAVAIAAWITWTATRGGAWSPVPGHVVRRMLELAELRPGEVLCDLGAGDGRILVTAARDLGARAVGFELDPLRGLVAAWRARLARVGDRVSVVRADFFTSPLPDPDVVTIWLSQAALNRLEPILLDSLRPGARVVAYRRQFPTWVPAATDPAHGLFLWVVPDRRPADSQMRKMIG